MKPGDRLDHQERMDLKRETPTNGSTRADATDTTAKTWRTTGARDVGATSQSEMPNAKRTMNAAQRPVLDCQRDTKETILAGEARPRTPMPATKIETTETISTATCLHLHCQTSIVSDGYQPPHAVIHYASYPFIVFVDDGSHPKFVSSRKKPYKVFHTHQANRPFCIFFRKILSFQRP
jgi:hypothetical protein